VPAPTAQMKVNLSSGELLGRGIQCLSRTIADMKGVYRDEESRGLLDQKMVVYQVEAFHPVDEGNEGGLFWGTTFLNPGMVGDEYFMTKGHHHAKRSRGEFYLTVAGSGALILMDESRKTVFEPMSTGTLHYVPAYTAHRIANTGNSLLTVLACWPSDAGHEYDVIARDGFRARLRNIGGFPVLVEER
jgi:glucose-6-phosphate isomerase, archaeal